MTIKFTPEELRLMAERADVNGMPQYAQALRQAAEDAERLAWITHNFRTCSLDMGSQHRYAPSSSLGSLRGPTFIEAVDTARKEPK